MIHKEYCSTTEKFEELREPITLLKRIRSLHDQTAILRTCRLLRQECLQHIQNKTLRLCRTTVDFDDVTELAPFLETIRDAYDPPNLLWDDEDIYTGGEERDIFKHLNRMLTTFPAVPVDLGLATEYIQSFTMPPLHQNEGMARTSTHWTADVLDSAFTQPQAALAIGQRLGNVQVLTIHVSLGPWLTSSFDTADEDHCRSAMDRTNIDVRLPHTLLPNLCKLQLLELPPNDPHSLSMIFEGTPGHLNRLDTALSVLVSRFAQGDRLNWIFMPERMNMRRIKESRKKFREMFRIAYAELEECEFHSVPLAEMSRSIRYCACRSA